MQETINLIEQKLGENKEVLRRLSDEQENFITALANGHLRKRELSNENENLKMQLEELYDQQSNKKMYCVGMAKETNQDKMVRQPGSHTKGEYMDRGEDIYKADKCH